MKRTTLIFTVSIPVTYDEAACTEEQAKDRVQKLAEEAIARACNGRQLDTTGKYIDFKGLVVAPAPTGEEPRRE